MIFDGIEKAEKAFMGLFYRANNGRMFVKRKDG
ncbi:MAG: NADPH-dependent curcumin reductase CurA [Candidatus Azotimanducaceae bacterium]|jgi:NADPH-dependent curcumin reductase CurA